MAVDRVLFQREGSFPPSILEWELGLLSCLGRERAEGGMLDSSIPHPDVCTNSWRVVPGLKQGLSPDWLGL